MSFDREGTCDNQNNARLVTFQVLFFLAYPTFILLYVHTQIVDWYRYHGQVPTKKKLKNSGIRITLLSLYSVLLRHYSYITLDCLGSPRSHYAAVRKCKGHGQYLPQLPHDGWN